MRDDVLSCSSFSSRVNGFGLVDLVRLLLFEACSVDFLFLDELRLCLDDRLDDLDDELDELDLEPLEPLLVSELLFVDFGILFYFVFSFTLNRFRLQFF